MTTDHMDLRTRLLAYVAVGTATVSVKLIDLSELLVAYDALAHPAAPKGKYSAEFEEAWSEYPTRPGNSKAAAWKAWQARLKAKVSPETLVEGVRKYAAYCKAKGTEAEFVKMASTFFGPAEHYAADWTAPRAAEPRRVIPDRRQELEDQKNAASAAAKARLLGHRPPPPDDGMTFEMEPRP